MMDAITRSFFPDLPLEWLHRGLDVFIPQLVQRPAEPLLGIPALPAVTLAANISAASGLLTAGIDANAAVRSAADTD